MEIAACRAEDVDELEPFMLSNSVAGHHGARFARQEAGDSTYLIPWLDGRPVGHAEVLWTGCEAPEVRAALPGCPEINGLLVWPEPRVTPTAYGRSRPTPACSSSRPSEGPGRNARKSPCNERLPIHDRRNDLAGMRKVAALQRQRTSS
ncbi:hypothetical protein ACWD1Y_08525 [Streptomyces sp. NPDC002814]